VKWVSGISLHGSNAEPPMSAMGQKQTFGPRNSMSALPPKADIGTHSSDVRFVPIADMTALVQTPPRVSHVHRLDSHHENRSIELHRYLCATREDSRE